MGYVYRKSDSIDSDDKKPICSFCKNLLRIGFDNGESDTILLCSKLGSVPDEIAAVECLKCASFIADLKEYDKIKYYFPDGFNIDEVNK